MLHRLKGITLQRLVGKAKAVTRQNPLERNYLTTTQLRAMGFKSVGENVRIEERVCVANPQFISIGDNVIIDQFTFIVAGEAGVRIGSHIHIAGHVLLGGNAGLVVEDMAAISAGSKLISASDDFGGDYLIGPAFDVEFCKVTREPIVLGRLSILGAGTVVLPGVMVAEGTATGANTVLNKSTEPWGTYLGAPGKRFKDRKQGALELAEKFLAKHAHEYPSAMSR